MFTLQRIPVGLILLKKCPMQDEGAESEMVEASIQLSRSAHTGSGGTGVSCFSESEGTGTSHPSQVQCRYNLASKFC